MLEADGAHCFSGLTSLSVPVKRLKILSVPVKRLRIETVRLLRSTRYAIPRSLYP